MSNSPSENHISSTFCHLPTHSWSIFGVFDRHSGPAISYFLKPNLLNAIIGALADLSSKHAPITREHELAMEPGSGRPEPPPEEIDWTIKEVFLRASATFPSPQPMKTSVPSSTPLVHLQYTHIAIDALSGRSCGTGFTCFWNVEDADRVVSLCEETTPTQKQKNPFVLPSILTPDPSLSLAWSLVLHGQMLNVVRAVTRDVVWKSKEEGERMREKADKRNMYLLREVVIMPNTPSAQYLTPAEAEKRTSSFNTRCALLKSNPSLLI